MNSGAMMPFRAYRPSASIRSAVVAVYPVVRAIESSLSASNTLKAKIGWTDKFIYPEYDFCITERLITNFHMPHSTLLMLVAAFAGYDFTMEAYQQAIKEKYRLFSFGDAMLILPCTMGTLGAIANGVVKNLIHRAADVILKEKKPLLLAVRETPFNRIHLENMLKVHAAGALLCPPMPSFYHHPNTIEEMAGFFSGRLADLLGIEVSGMKRWQGI